LLRHGFSVIALHGDMDQPARMAALDQFRRNEVTLLVASDVAARGLDIPAVSHIYNFDVPHHPDDYVHRIGRTGRAGRSGTAITLVAPADGKSVAAIEKLIGQAIPWGSSPAPDLADEAAPRAAERPRHRGAAAWGPAGQGPPGGGPEPGGATGGPRQDQGAPSRAEPPARQRGLSSPGFSAKAGEGLSLQRRGVRAARFAALPFSGFAFGSL